MDDRITRGSDGVYRWRYEMSLLKSPVIFFSVWKILFWISVGIFGFMALLDLKGILHILKAFAIFQLGMTVMVWIGCAVYALFFGGRYCVEFEMDDTGVTHRQNAQQAAKVQKALRYQYTYRASGHTEMRTDFARVTAVKVRRRWHLITLREGIETNQVYVPEEDFDLVLDHILSHCDQIKK